MNVLGYHTINGMSDRCDKVCIRKKRKIFLGIEMAVKHFKVRGNKFGMLYDGISRSTRISISVIIKDYASIIAS